MKYLQFILLLILFAPFALSAQQSGKAKETASYTKEGNRIVFNADDGSKLLLEVLSSSVVKVWFDPAGTFIRNNESFAVVNEDLEDIGEINVNDEPSCYEIYTSKLRIRLNKNPMQLQIFDKWQKLLFSDFKEIGHVSDSNTKKAYKMLRRDEQFFGLGEKAGPLNRRGREYKMWNSDRPCYSTTEDPLYKSIPFFMSSYQYGIFLDNTYKTEFKFGTESEEYYSFEAPDGAFVYYFIFGKDYKDILGQYITLTGQPIMPPKWALGFAQSRGLYTREAQALEVAAEFRKREIPIDIIYQDIGWTQYLQDFEWREGNYTNPKQMLSILSQQGFKVILSQDPVISQANKKQWEEADRLGYFVKDARTGKSYDMPWPWGGNCGVVDFTIPEVADWWGEYQQKPLDDGAHGFWTDMGEPAWSNEEDLDRLHMRHHIGMHDEIHNVYGLTWDKVVKEQFEKRNPGKRVFQMTRAAYAGLQRYTFGWSGDSGNANDVLEGWGQLQNQVAVGISAGLGGIPFWTTDISGYCGDITDYPAMAELYTRWMQFGIFNPLSRAHHEGDNAVEPWMFGEVAEKNSKAAIELKYRLFPYLYSYARKAHDTGLPIMRGLFMEYPYDEQAVKVEDQFLFGEELLVAPVLRKGERVKRLYLPEGEWIDFNDKKTVYLGGQQIAYRAPLNVIPLFVKKGSIIPMMPVMQYIHEKKDYPLFIHIFPNYEDEVAEFELYEDDGENLDYLKDIASRTRFTCTTLSDGYRTVVEPSDNGFRQSDKRNMILTYHLDEMPASVTVNGKTAKKTDEASIAGKAETDINSIEWSWNDQSNVCLVKVPDQRKQVTVLLTN
ncbi:MULTISPECIES: TIM-barrel domain-containing protein [Proteiniphilum]|jgi:alpha-glucosidase|uniref:glycoside hydrolase family 31 protein n=1 Tax=Proteiniphilum TaxID=294702 RepID=UPI0028A58DBD|nr:MULTISPECIES: TIM-barrel domain-containing protein [Proteiniphilum]MDY9917668.1 glycoside hydrolase family 31 protein [Proteiniphilum sp.]